MALKG
jgi:hypothetical protein